ncbi:rab guanine nucleotide exchange factor S2 [Vermiconidia calcicola]|uniref:Rab guanine nucleotide exchange factor S2 n=1 Tax=Vermiconidia calcicola TaxID=1690605 RepID=A0ACC3MPT5_9PEZI|nr:rab guanine nucleotide exchange factor S2 [Vermiconidia calcicola]
MQELGVTVIDLPIRSRKHFSCSAIPQHPAPIDVIIHLSRLEISTRSAIQSARKGHDDYAEDSFIYQRTNKSILQLNALPRRSVRPDEIHHISRPSNRSPVRLEANRPNGRQQPRAKQTGTTVAEYVVPHPPHLPSHTDSGNPRSFLFISNWANGASSLMSTTRPTNTLTRSVTPSPTSTTSKLRGAIPLPHLLVKSKSSSQLRDSGVEGVGAGGGSAMAAPAVAPPVSAIRDEAMTDTRTPSPSPGTPDHDEAPNGEAQAAAVPTNEDVDYKPDLSQEVAMLSTKLVNAINYQTNLDDTLQSTRHELTQSQRELRRVRAEKRSLDDAITQGVLVKKSEVDKTIAALRADLARETLARENAEKARRQTDGELENLTANLFEEANKMVASARRDTEAVERRNERLEGKVRDTEALVQSQQEQLRDLKGTLEKVSLGGGGMREGSAPGTPVVGSDSWDNPAALNHNGMSTPSGGDHTAEEAPEEVQPNHPLHFSHLISPVLRTDIPAYTDFTELLSWARRSTANTNSPHSRSTSGANNNASQTNLTSMTSSPNLPGAFTFSSSSSNNSPTTASNWPPPLKDSKFYKRCQTEDLEPTLRLDLAPGLSFLSRRTVTSALLTGTLAIEPFSPPPAHASKYTSAYYGTSTIFSCSLCGEGRGGEVYARRHRLRVSETEDAARYPLCGFCLERVRSCADFVGWLRMVREGYVKVGKGVWEECVRLRERMFWARLGGGVVPVQGQQQQQQQQRESLQSHRQLAEEEREMEEKMEEVNEKLEHAAEEPLKKEGEIRMQTAYDDGDEGLGIGRAVVDMPSPALSTAVPEVQPPSSRQEAVDVAPPPPPSPPPQREDMQKDPPQRPSSPPPAQQPEEYPTTPSASTAGAEEQAEKEEDEMRTPPETPAAEEDEERGRISQTTIAEESARLSLAAQPEERRPSSVLARVRAMEGRGK